MTDTSLFTASQGEVFIQLNGPGVSNALQSLGQCTDLDDIVEPKQTATPIICRDKYRNFIQKGESLAAPGKVTSGLTILSGAVRSALEKVSCHYSLYVVQKACGYKGTYVDGELITILNNVRNEQHTYQNQVKRESDESSMFNATIAAWFPVLRVVGAGKMNVERIATSETMSINDIDFVSEEECEPECNQVGKCELGMAVCDANTGVSANVLYTSNYGATWAATATDPFGNDEHIMAVTHVRLPSGTIRWIVGKEGTGGAVQGEIAYSDDAGANWTTVNIGGATAGHGAVRGGGLFALDYSHIWLASAAGYIYFSADGGVTWTAQESGTIGVADYTQIHFHNESYGITGAAADVILFTRDGGSHWAAVTATGGGGDILSVEAVTPSKLMVGTDDGTLWMSEDYGVTWTQITGFTGSGVGNVQDISMLNEHVGYILMDNASPVGTILKTFDGGRSFQVLTNPATNAGANALFACDMNNAWAGGEASGGTALIYRAYEE